jgi:hypothetical protein
VKKSTTITAELRIRSATEAQIERSGLRHPSAGFKLDASSGNPQIDATEGVVLGDVGLFIVIDEVLARRLDITKPIRVSIDLPLRESK